MDADDISVEQKKRLALLVGELKKRGLDIPDEIKNIRLKRSHYDFKLAPNGYFPKYFTGTYYNPKPYHEEFIKSRALYVALIGSRGCGKSSGGAQKANDKIRQGQSGMVLNPDFENFKISTWPEFREWIPWNMVSPSQRYMSKEDWQPHQPFKLTFMNGAQVLCKGLKDANSARGPNSNWLWYDEAQRDQTGLAFQIASACIRVGTDPQRWITATPTDTFSWMYKFFVVKDIPQEALDEYEKLGTDRPLIDVYYGTMEENRDNLSPDFLTSMFMAYPAGFLRDREVKGMFSNEGGSLGSASWFDDHVVSTLEDIPTFMSFDDDNPITIKTIRYYDLAASEKKIAHGKKLNDPDETVGTKLTWNHREDFCIEDQVCGRWKYEQIENIIVQTAERDGPEIKIYIEQEPGAGGINQVMALAKAVRERLGTAWKVELHNPKTQGDKVMRANPWFAEAERGHFWMLKGEWNRETLAQLAAFPTAPHDDRVDSVSGARAVIAPFKLWKETKFLHL